MGAYRPAYGSTAPESAQTDVTDTNVGDTYTVQAGDTLSAIAERYGATVEQLAAWNQIPDSNWILPGQVLLVREPEPGVDQEPPEWSNADTKEARIDALAREVIAGQYGNGLARVFALGRDYDIVQTRVNEILAGK